MSVENNKIIAEFMGARLGNGTEKFPIVYINVPSGLAGLCTQTPDMMRFHFDWNCLMEVVEEIESLGNHGFTIYRKTTNINSLPIELANTRKTTKIEAVYNACIEFIKWYNKTNHYICTVK